MSNISSTFPAMQEKDIEYCASLLLDMKNDSYYESSELESIIIDYNTKRQSNQISVPDIGMKVYISKSELPKYFGEIVDKGHGFYTIVSNNGEILKLRRNCFIVI